MANYGDAALTLGPQWARYKENDQNFALQIVGHQDGVADVHLKDDPDKRHQFAWTDTKYADEVAINRTKGYAFVKKDDGWVKADGLWEWDAEGFLAFRGLRLMARPVERLAEDMAKRAEQRKKVFETPNKDEQAVRDLAERMGISITEDGERPKARRKGLRNG